MIYLANNPYRTGDIYHHGIKGQKWGIRRYQNPDGTLTEAGKKRYKKFYGDDGSLNEKGQAKFDKMATRLRKMDDHRDKWLSLAVKAENKAHRVDDSFIRSLLTSDRARDKMDRSITRYNDRYNSAVVKGKKYVKKMERMFGADLVSTIHRNT